MLRLNLTMQCFYHEAWTFVEILKSWLDILRIVPPVVARHSEKMDPYVYRIVREIQQFKHCRGRFSR